MTVDAASAVLLAAIEGPHLSPDEEAFFRKEGLAGVTLFKRNIPSSFLDLRDMLSRLEELNPRPSKMVIAIDQEGGRVSRIGEPFPNLGPPLKILQGQTDVKALDLLSNYGFTVALVLKGLGINLNFAPVCDILTSDNNPAIGDRTFGLEANEVVLRAGAFLSGMEQGGVIGCLKHFPGQGDANFDTHEGIAKIDANRDLLMTREIIPFQALLKQNRPVMVSHAIYPALDEQLASLSKVIIQDLLRQSLGFQGLIISDDFNMKAIPQSEQDWVDAMIASILAGVDLILVCRGLDRCQAALDGLRRESARSRVFAKRLEDAAHQVMKLRSSL